jgi:hypothetical protein
MAQPVTKMTMPGMRLRFGCPFLLRLSQTPTRPAAHQMIPMDVCTPSVLREGVDAAPSRNDKGVEELLAATSPLQPHLTHEQQDDEDDAVGNEGAAHNEVGKTLTGVISPAESKRSDASKEELHPGHNRQCLSHHSVSNDHHPANLAVDTLFEVELQVDTHDDLCDQHEHDDRDELGVDIIFRELPALVFMAQEVADDGKNGAGDLYGNVPFGADYLWWSAS